MRVAMNKRERMKDSLQAQGMLSSWHMGSRILHFRACFDTGFGFFALRVNLDGRGGHQVGISSHRIVITVKYRGKKVGMREIDPKKKHLCMSRY